MDYSVYQLLWLFLIYAFLGWCCEIGYCGIEEGHFVNRGFLNGPWCPIYGIGGVIIVLFLTPISDNPFLLFLGSFVLCTAIEYITGAALEKIYHARWWDYRDKMFNLNGYVCLEFSIIWGFFGIFLMKVIHPAIFSLVKHLGNIGGYLSFGFVCAVFITDLVLTVLALNKMERMIRNADELSEHIRDTTEKLARGIYANAVKVDTFGKEIAEREDVREFVERAKEREERLREMTDKQLSQLRAEHEDEIEELAQRLAALKSKYEAFKTERDDEIAQQRKRLAELKEKYASSTDVKNIFIGRLIKAFPHMKFNVHEEQFEKLREKILKK